MQRFDSAVLKQSFLALASAGVLTCAPAHAQPKAVPAAATPGAVGAKLAAHTHLLPATLETTQWGWYDNAQPPVLRIQSGDTVVMETMMHSHNAVTPGRTIEELKKLRTDHPGRGPHTLTGPIYVEGAEPGDVLKVKINKIVPRAYGTVFNIPGMFGQFPKDFADGQVKFLYLDNVRKVAEYLPGIEVPLAPFPGSMGVARAEPGRYSSVPPGEFAGNMDIRDFVAGSTLYVPVHVKGALLWSGDSHAAQGNGEVSLTAIETAFQELNITATVLKGTKLDMPRIETSKSWITMGFDKDLNLAWKQAHAETAKFLSEQRKVSLAAAEALAHTVSDCRVSQVVNIKKGVHCLSSKDVARADVADRPLAETRDEFVTVGRNADLNLAMDSASMDMINLLQSKKGLTRLDAYGLASVAMDCRVGRVADAEKLVHCVLPKSLWVAGK